LNIESNKKKDSYSSQKLQ